MNYQDINAEAIDRWILEGWELGTAESEYGRRPMHSMMMTYDGDRKRYAKLSGHGYRMLAEAVRSVKSFRRQVPGHDYLR